MKNNRLLEFFGMSEGEFDSLNRQLAGATSVAKPQRKYTPSTAKAQSDVDSARSVVKKEASGLGMQVHFTNQELDRIMDWAAEDQGDPMADAILKKVQDVGRNGGTDGSGSDQSSGHPGSLLQMSPRLKP